MKGVFKFMEWLIGGWSLCVCPEVWTANNFHSIEKTAVKLCTRSASSVDYMPVDISCQFNIHDSGI